MWLVGMMGAGKSAVGRVLALELELPFVDIDEEIAREAGVTIPEIFEREGESGFRERELRAIGAAAGRAIVASLGGGALTQPAAREVVLGVGQSIYLRASIDTLLRRVGDGASRPLLAGLDRAARRERIESLLAGRDADYETASIIIETDGKRPKGVAREIVKRLRQPLATSKEEE